MTKRCETRVLKDQRGFTLIELLVVVIIIGILAAIAIPSYLAQRQNGYDADAQSIGHTAATAAISYSASKGNYAGMDAIALHDLEDTLPDPAAADFPAPYSTYTITVLPGDTDFQIDVKHSGGARTFRFDNSGRVEIP